MKKNKNILILSGIYPPDVGGPANYAYQLNKEFQNLGYSTDVATFRFERKLPTGVRHVWFFIKILPKIFKSDVVILLDTFSVALPGVLASKLLGKKTILRTGGDFLWEAYVERVQKPVTLTEFYSSFPNDLSQKEQKIFKLTKWLLSKIDTIVYSTKYQRDLFEKGYCVQRKKTAVVENYLGEKRNSIKPDKKIFLWAGRKMFLKNTKRLKEAFMIAKEKNNDIELELNMQIPRDLLLEKIKKCYAVIVPSLSEISPNMILESIMFEKPFIVTKEVGNIDTIKEFGLFVNPKSSQDIADKILELADDSVYEIKLENIKNSEKKHSYADIAREFEKMLF